MEYPSMELLNRGSIVSCTTCFNQTIEGGVMAFDPTTKMLILSILFAKDNNNNNNNNNTLTRHRVHSTPEHRSLVWASPKRHHHHY